MVEIDKKQLKLSFWKIVSNLLMLYLILGTVYAVAMMCFGEIDIFKNKNFWLNFFSVGVSAFLNYFLPIPGHQIKKEIFNSFLCGFGIMLLSSLNYLFCR